MAEVELRKVHAFGIEKAKERAREAELELSQRLTVKTWWEGDTMHFTLAGARGSVVIAEADVHLHIKLTAWTSPLRPLVLRKAREVLDCWFAP